jgi:hypothetical protein
VPFAASCSRSGDRPGDVVVRGGVREPDLHVESLGELAHDPELPGRDDEHEPVVAAAEEQPTAVLLHPQLEQFGDRVGPGRRGIRHRHRHRRGRQRSPQVARDAAGQGRVAGQQRLEQPRTQGAACPAEPLLLFEREAGHCDDGGHDPATLLVEVAGGDGDDAAEVSAAAQGLQGERDVTEAQRRTGARPAVQHPRHLALQGVGGAGIQSADGMLSRQLARRVEHAHPGVELPRELGDGRAQPVRPQGRKGDRALRRERPAAPRVRLGRDRLGVGPGDGDEGRAVRHLEQRHPFVPARRREGRRHARASDLGAEAESDHTA